MITDIGDKIPEDIKKQDLECVVPKQENDPSEVKEESVPVQYLSRMPLGPSAQGLLPKTTIAKEVRGGLTYGAPTAGSRFSVNSSSYFDISGQTWPRQSSSRGFCISLYDSGLDQHYPEG